MCAVPSVLQGPRRLGEKPCIMCVQLYLGLILTEKGLQACTGRGVKRLAGQQQHTTQVTLHWCSAPGATAAAHAAVIERI
jgi:hypothetical protein